MKQTKPEPNGASQLIPVLCGPLSAEKVELTDAGRHREDEAKRRLMRSLALVVAGVVVVLGVAGVVIPDIVIDTGGTWFPLPGYTLLPRFGSEPGSC
jgi:hypothetical protein